jgi:hypothetical protein
MASMGGDYRTALYYDITNGVFTREVDHDIWTLAFSSDELDTSIFLNSSNFMFAQATGDTSFMAIQDTVQGKPWNYDFPTGVEHRRSLKNCWSAEGATREVHVLNMGFNHQGQPLGYYKFQLLHFDLNSYTFRYSRLDGTEYKRVTLQREEGKRRLMYDFFTHSQQDIEPLRNNWDLCFTQYTDYAITDAGDTLEYLVRGVLIDPAETSVARADDIGWGNLNSATIAGLDFSNEENKIGYDWKIYSFDLQAYETFPEMVYVLNLGLRGYFALRFIDFYDDQGERGHVSFEIKAL